LLCQSGAVITIYTESSSRPSTQQSATTWNSSADGIHQCAQLSYDSSDGWKSACLQNGTSGFTNTGVEYVSCDSYTHDVDFLIMTGSAEGKLFASALEVDQPRYSGPAPYISVSGSYNGSDHRFDEIRLKKYEIMMVSRSMWTYKVQRRSASGAAEWIESDVNHTTGVSQNVDGFDIDVTNMPIDGSIGPPLDAGDKWTFHIFRDKFKWCERIGVDDTCSASQADKHAEDKWWTQSAQMHGSGREIGTDDGLNAFEFLSSGIFVHFENALGHTLHDAWFTEVRPWSLIDEWLFTIEDVPSRYANVSMQSGLSVYIDFGENEHIRPETIDLDYGCWDHSSVMMTNYSTFLAQPDPTLASITRTTTGCKLTYQGYASNTGAFAGEETLLFDSTYTDDMYDVTWEPKVISFPNDMSKDWEFSVGDSLTQAKSVARVSKASSTNVVMVHILSPGFFDTSQSIEHCTVSNATISTDGVYGCAIAPNLLSPPQSVVSFSQSVSAPKACACAPHKTGSHCETDAERVDSWGIAFIKDSSTSPWKCKEKCCGKGSKAAASPIVDSQHGTVNNKLEVSGAYSGIGAPTYQIEVTETSSSNIAFTFCTSCDTGPFITGAATPDTKQLLEDGLYIVFQNTANEWKAGELWEFAISPSCTCDPGFFNSDAGDCGSKCDKGYEAGHFQCGSQCDHGIAYSGVCICDPDRTGAACDQTCSTTQQHQHCKFGNHRAELLEIISDQELVCRAPPQQVKSQPGDQGLAVDISLTKTDKYTNGAVTSRTSEYTDSGVKVIVV